MRAKAHRGDEPSEYDATSDNIRLDGKPNFDPIAQADPTERDATSDDIRLDGRPNTDPDTGSQPTR